MSWPPVCFFSGVAHSKTIDLNWSYKALAKKKALTIYQDRAFASFSCVQLLSSVLQRFTHLYCDISSLGERSTGILGNKAHTILFFRIFPIYMFASKYNIKRREKKLSLTAFYELFLSDIKIKILKNPWHFFHVTFGSTLFCSLFDWHSQLNERC